MIFVLLHREAQRKTQKNTEFFLKIFTNISVYLCETTSVPLSVTKKMCNFAPKNKRKNK